MGEKSVGEKSVGEKFVVEKSVGGKSAGEKFPNMFYLFHLAGQLVSIVHVPFHFILDLVFVTFFSGI